MSIENALKNFESFIDEDRAYALKHKIKCENKGCNWIAEHRCVTCLGRGVNHWFCRPMVYIPKYYGAYAFSFEKGLPWIEYNNSHSDEHSDKVHPPKPLYRIENVKEV